MSSLRGFPFLRFEVIRYVVSGYRSAGNGDKNALQVGKREVFPWAFSLTDRTARLSPAVATPALAARNGLAVNVDLADVHPAAGAMAAAGSKVREADLIHLAQVGTGHEIALGLDLVGI
jgi:hypothetical protein